jgi:glutathione S-transferase
MHPHRRPARHEADVSYKLYYHPLSSFCHKALVGLYELDVPFEPVVVNLGDPESRAAFLAIWPMGRFPVLVDGDEVVPESTVLLEHADDGRLIPADRALRVRALDRFFDLHIHTPMQALISDIRRPPDDRDPLAVAAAHRQLDTAYQVVESTIGDAWAAGDRFTLADCAAAPALFYANLAHPVPGPRTLAYLRRLMDRPSVARVIREAGPYFRYYPLVDRIPSTYPGLVAA